MEKLFKFYYDYLDEMRMDVLGEEYKIRMQMDEIEDKIKRIVSELKTFNYVEFYHNSESLNEDIAGIRGDLKRFNMYMPKYQLTTTDLDALHSKVKVDIRERINSAIQECDHSFALYNFDFVVKNHPDHTVVSAYKELGPFDFFTVPEGEIEEERNYVDKFD